MGKKGGAQPGAGRPRGVASIRAQEFREKVMEALEKEARPIIEKAIEQAKEGNQQARDWLTDRGIGRAMQALEISGRDGEPLTIPDEQYKQAIRAAIKGGRSNTDGA